MDDTQQKIALVTGANQGIGKAIAQGLAQQGITVLLGARNEEKGRQAAEELASSGTVIFLQIDVTDEGAINAAAQNIERRFARLDILINNAGTNVGRDTPSNVTAQMMREVYETNVFGVVAVTHAMLPLLRKSAAGRIVNISSLRGSLGSPGAFVGQPSLPYSSSKTALNAVTVHYARELADTMIKVNAAAPGHVATAFNNYSGTRTPEQGAAIAIKLALLDTAGPTGGFFDDNGPLPW